MQIGIERGSVQSTIDQTADVVVAASATLEAVTGLVLELKAGVEYVVSGRITATSSAAAQDVKAGVSGSSALTGHWEWVTVPVGNVPLPAIATLVAGAIPASAVSDISATTDVGVIDFSGVVTSAVDVDLQINAAQGTAAGTTTVADSWVMARIKNQ